MAMMQHTWLEPNASHTSNREEVLQQELLALHSALKTQYIYIYYVLLLLCMCRAGLVEVFYAHGPSIHGTRDEDNEHRCCKHML